MEEDIKVGDWLSWNAVNGKRSGQVREMTFDRETSLVVVCEGDGLFDLEKIRGCARKVAVKDI